MQKKIYPFILLIFLALACGSDDSPTTPSEEAGCAIIQHGNAGSADLVVSEELPALETVTIAGNTIYYFGGATYAKTYPI